MKKYNKNQGTNHLLVAFRADLCRILPAHRLLRCRHGRLARDQWISALFFPIATRLNVALIAHAVAFSTLFKGTGPVVLDTALGVPGIWAIYFPKIPSGKAV